MAPRYRKVTVAIWADAKFRALSPLKPSGQALWLYLLTARETIKIPGLIPSGKAALAESLRWEPEAFGKAFAEALAQGMVEADWNAPLVFLPNAIEHNAPESPNVVTGWRDQWAEIPECSLKHKAWQRLKVFTEGIGEGFGKAFREACPEPCRHPSPNQEQEQEQEQETTLVAEPAGSSDPAAPPSLPSSAAGEAETTPPKAQPSASPKPDPAWEKVAEVWTTVCVPAGFSAARGTTAQRKKAATRMREAGWFDAFRVACAHVAATPFYRGDNDRGWAATLSWFLEPNNSEKTAEKAETKRGTNGRRTEDAELLRALAEAERGDDGEPGPDDSEPGSGDGRDGPGVRFSPPLDPPANDVAASAAPVSAALGTLLGHRR